MIEEYMVADGVMAFSTTRKGGVSTGNYGEFNINEYCGDEPANVAQNRKILAAKLGIADNHILLPHQVHGMEVRQIGEEFMTLPENIRKMVLEGVDAVMTDLSGFCIGVSTADCIPVLLYDEAHHAIAAIHAGWRGTVGRIVQKTIASMRASFQTNPAELKAVIGPGISLDNFEVGDEVYEEFVQGAFDMSTIAEQRPNSKKQGNLEQPLKWHINLPLCNVQLLEQAGVKAENILQAGICTYDHSEEYFSARRLGTESGRIYTGIILK